MTGGVAGRGPAPASCSRVEGSPRLPARAGRGLPDHPHDRAGRPTGPGCAGWSPPRPLPLTSAGQRLSDDAVCEPAAVPRVTRSGRPHGCNRTIGTSPVPKRDPQTKEPVSAALSVDTAFTSAHSRVPLRNIWLAVACNGTPVRLRHLGTAPALCPVIGPLPGLRQNAISPFSKAVPLLSDRYWVAVIWGNRNDKARELIGGARP